MTINAGPLNSGPINAPLSAGFELAGQVTELGSPVARTVLAYVRSTGALHGSTTSDGITGNWSITVPDGTTEYFVVALDDAAGNSYNALIFDKVVGSAV